MLTLIDDRLLRFQLVERRDWEGNIRHVQVHLVVVGVFALLVNGRGAQLVEQVVGQQALVIQLGFNLELAIVLRVGLRRQVDDVSEVVFL